jgi:hypothetical protein
VIYLPAILLHNRAEPIEMTQAQRLKGEKTMSYLKRENLNRCFSLLREFVEESTAQNDKKGTAILALSQLQKVMAGAEVPTADPLPGCSGRPIADRS